MSSLSVEVMHEYLSKSISSFNRNKLNGLLAEVDFRHYLNRINFGDRVSLGGWIARSEGAGNFGHSTVVIFPEIIQPNVLYPSTRHLPEPTHGLHTICATFHQIGIQSYFCAPTIMQTDDYSSIEWFSVQLGLPTQQGYLPLARNIVGFNHRNRRYNFLRYHSDISALPDSTVPEEFTKENLRIIFQSQFMSEISDINGILWGSRYTYPLYIQEKPSAKNNRLGVYFGLDVAPFVKHMFYSDNRGILHPIVVIREVDRVDSHNFIGWWFITFDQFAKFASRASISGGPGMHGGRSTVIKIPKSEFQILNKETLSRL